MSNRNNDVFQVLVTKGNQAVLAAGADISTLAVGQLGAFDPNTGLSIGSATSPVPREFYFAVGIDRSGSGTLEDLRQSAGQFIQRKGITSYTFEPHTAGRPMIVKIGGYVPVADTTYGIRVELRNSKIYNIQGYNQFSKAYVVKTPTDLADFNVLTQLMLTEINLDPSGILVAKPVARQALTIVTHGTSADYAAGAIMTDADVARLITFNLTAAANARVYTDFTLQSVPLKVTAFSQVNLGFHKLLETALIVSLIDGFGSSAKVTIVQEIVYEEGSGTNIKQKEYHSSSYAGSGPYVLSETTGTSKGDILYLAVEATKYDQFIWQYAFTSESGWLDYSNTLNTVFATPEADTTTRASLATLLDALVLPGAFEPLADDAAAASATSTVVEADPASTAVDGIA